MEMAFCKFSTEIATNKFTVIDNTFFEKYMSGADGTQLKVYLWGLYLCNNQTTINSNLGTLKTFADDIGLSEDEVLSAFEYWQAQGLVQIIASNPPEIQYLPVKDAISKKMYKPEKYEQFNLQAQSILSGRQLTPNEFREYYDLIETFKMAPEALLMIIQYCVDNKDNKVGYSYILTVAKNWAYDGILSLSQVEEKLQQFSTADKNVRVILKAMGISRNPTFDERQLYLKWCKLGFTLDVISFVAKKVKKGGCTTLDNRLNKYYELHLFSQKEIDTYENNKESLFALAIEINKTIGVYYENIEPIVENYVNPWLMRGFSKESITLIATYCFKTSVRSLEGMNDIVMKFYKNGLTTVDSIVQYIEKFKQQDENIRTVLQKSKLLRNITSLDRDFYRTWVYSWNMTQEMIEYAATLAADKGQPMQYINKILGTWYENKITTLDAAKQQKDLFKYTTQSSSAVHSRSYSEEELNNIFSNIEEVEI